jgi:Fur family ferric uptake transcriptional regulator
MPAEVEPVVICTGTHRPESNRSRSARAAVSACPCAGPALCSTPVARDGHEQGMAIFQDFLKSRGLKLTSQRSVLARKVFNTEKYFSAEELLEDSRREKRPISKATVYRTLALLEESTLINSIDFQRGHKFYEHARATGAPLQHVVCVECLAVVEFAEPALEALHERVARRLGFRAVSYAYKIYGVCAACAARGKGPTT